MSEPTTTTQAQPEGGQDAYTRDRMQNIAALVDSEIPVDWGFVVMVFPLNGRQGRLNYVSNASRDSVNELLQDFLRNGGATFEHTEATRDREVARLQAEKAALRRNLENLLTLTSRRDQAEINQFIEEILKGVVVA